MIDSIRLYFNRKKGYKMLKYGRLEDALKYFEKNMLISNEPNCLYDCAVAMVGIGRDLDAKMYLEKILEEYPENEMALSLMLSANIHLKEWSEALDDCEKMRLKFPTNMKFVQLYDLLQDEDKREKFVDSQKQVLLGNAFLREKKYNQALECFKQSIKFDPESSVAYNNLATTYFKLKQKDKAFEAIRKAAEIAPHSEQINKNLRKFHK